MSSPVTFFPHPYENHLQLAYGPAFYSAVHIAPFPDFIRAVYVIVCHVHSSSISYISVDDDNLSVVACEHVVYPWETQWVELINLDAVFAQPFGMLFLKRAVIGVVAEPIEQGPYLHAFLCLAAQ